MENQENNNSVADVAQDPDTITYQPTQLKDTVFPSTEAPVWSMCTDEAGGISWYIAAMNAGVDSEHVPVFLSEGHSIRFASVDSMGVGIPGLIEEELLIILKDRTTKLNAMSPDPEYDKMLTGLDICLRALKAKRIHDGANDDTDIVSDVEA